MSYYEEKIKNKDVTIPQNNNVLEDNIIENNIRKSSLIIVFIISLVFNLYLSFFNGNKNSDFKEFLLLPVFVIVPTIIVGAIVNSLLLSLYEFFQNLKLKQNSDVNKVFANLNKKYKPLKKIEIIKELFIDCATFSSKNLYDKDNAVKNSIFTAELALHIFCLWVSNLLIKYDTKEEKLQFIEGINFQAYIIAVKDYLNLIVKNLAQKELDKDTIMSIVMSRVQQILKEKDMEIRNFNFLNICNLAIKYEEPTVFVCGDFDNLPIIPGNPLDMMFLPLAYKTGLIDKYLQKL